MGKPVGADSLYGYLHQGGLPQYLQSDNRDVLADLVNDIVYRDVAVRYNIRDEHSLKSLLAYLMGNVGNLVSATKVKQMLGMKSTSTVSDYFSYLEQTYLIGFVPKFSYSYKAQLLNPKKVYCVDNGIVSVVSPSFTRDEGRRLENMVFYDLTAENRRREVDGLLDALAFLRMDEEVILTYNQRDKFLVEDKTIEVLPAFEYFTSHEHFGG